MTSSLYQEQPAQWGEDTEYALASVSQATPCDRLFSESESESESEEEATWILPVVSIVKRRRIFAALRNQKELSLVQKLLMSSGIYAIASLTSPLVALIVAPFLAYHLSGTDYGILAVLSTVISLVAGVTQLGLGSAFFRAYNYDYETRRDHLGVVTTVIVLLLLASLPTTAAIIVFAPELAQLLFNRPDLAQTVQIASLVILLQNLTIPGLSWLRAVNRAFSFSMLSVISLLVTLGATIFLVGTLRLGINGALLAMAASYGAIVICSLLVVLLRAISLLRLDIARGLLAFGLPNVANFLAVWILQLSDRYLLGHLATFSQTASYAVAYSLGSVLSAVVIAPFSLAWPTVMFAVAKREDATSLFKLIFRWFSMLLLWATFGLSLLAVAILDKLFPHAYTSASAIIPVIAASMAFYGIYILFNIGTSIRRKTWFAVIFTTCAALINVGLNLVLIRPYGAMGAAVSTLLAYAILSLVAYLVNQRLYPLHFEVGLFCVGLLVGIMLYTGSSYLGMHQSIYLAWGIQGAALCLYSGFLFALGKYTR